MKFSSVIVFTVFAGILLSESQGKTLYANETDERVDVDARDIFKAIDGSDRAGVMRPLQMSNEYYYCLMRGHLGQYVGQYWRKKNLCTAWYNHGFARSTLDPHWFKILYRSSGINRWVKYRNNNLPPGAVYVDGVPPYNEKVFLCIAFVKMTPTSKGKVLAPGYMMEGKHECNVYRRYREMNEYYSVKERNFWVLVADSSRPVFWKPLECA